ncbi:hypothetical protein Cgig2_013312 [Carnegiea gigantea]|uniref:Uncharacterized protein n=1 Tax=Carnegiea gigantea TaxID=171969 RepID=A0A9Q1JHW6_9CARY|nr:hypothetical protein Cgig2_013312 [Carnegiea gigantea]
MPLLLMVKCLTCNSAFITYSAHSLPSISQSSDHLLSYLLLFTRRSYLCLKSRKYLGQIVAVCTSMSHTSASWLWLDRVDEVPMMLCNRATIMIKFRALIWKLNCSQALFASGIWVSDSDRSCPNVTILNDEMRWPANLYQAVGSSWGSTGSLCDSTEFHRQTYVDGPQVSRLAVSCLVYVLWLQLLKWVPLNYCFRAIHLLPLADISGFKLKPVILIIIQEVAHFRILCFTFMLIKVTLHVFHISPKLLFPSLTFMLWMPTKLWSLTTHEYVAMYLISQVSGEELIQVCLPRPCMGSILRDQMNHFFFT